MKYLEKLENYEVPLKAPWLEKKLKSGGKK